MIGLYVHLPFCRVHCSYCPFAISTDIELQDRYVDALVREIRCSAADSAAADTVYFGGGTPSRTSIPNLQRIVAALNIAPGAEFSLEANPEDVTEEALNAWRDLGVNRISIGVQSFHDDELKAIGRIHDSRGAIEAIERATGSGLRTNLDLILGLPQQTRESFAKTLDQAIALAPGHLSLYMLDLDETTPLQVQVARGRVEVPDDELVADQYQYAIDRLEAAGLHQYEISNFARTGEECRHNLRYWTRGEYRGFGLAAHSFLGERRFANTRDIHRYIQGSASDFVEELNDIERRHELVFLRLRQTGGINYDDLLQLCGEEAVGWIEQGVSEGWLLREGSRVAFTPAGFLVSSELISQLF